VSQSEGGRRGADGSKLRNKLWRARTPSGSQSCVEVRKGSHEMEEIKTTAFQETATNAFIPVILLIYTAYEDGTDRVFRNVGI
jgi:hypothetical protein